MEEAEGETYLDLRGEKGADAFPYSGKGETART